MKTLDELIELLPKVGAPTSADRKLGCEAALKLEKMRDALRPFADQLNTMHAFGAFETVVTFAEILKAQEALE